MKTILIKLADHIIGGIMAILYHFLVSVYYLFKKKHSIRKTGRVTRYNPFTDKF